MLRKLTDISVALLLAVVLLLAPAAPSLASPAHPTLGEVNSVIDVLRFRSAMQTDPPKAMATYSADYGLASLRGLDSRMKAAGINTGAGWRYLLGTAVFTATGVAQKKSLVVFYNPWADSALFTVWQPVGKTRRIVDAAWVPGDLVRKARAEIDPKPLWLRGKGYRPDTLAQSVIGTTKAIETRFGDPGKVLAWRETLGIKDAVTFNKLIVPLEALTLYETLLRVKALAVPVPGEDPMLAPLRSATAGFIKMVSTKGFRQPLADARDTTAVMKTALSRINPKTMAGLAPVAFVAGTGNVTMFFASTVSADFMISVRFVEKGGKYKAAQIEFVPYAATYQAAVSSGSPNAAR